jgi:ribosomal protein S8E
VAEAFDKAMKTDGTGLARNSGKSKHYGAAKARQRRDFPLGQPREIIQRLVLQQPEKSISRGQLGREPLQTDVGKTDRRHRAAQSHRATGGNGQRRKPPVRLQQSQIIGRIHLNNFGGNETCARDQTNLRRILDDMKTGKLFCERC